MTRLRRPSLVGVIAAVMLAAVPALGVLQYRWLGRVSEAERDRMRASLETATAQFRAAFDAEIAGVYGAVAMDGETYAARDWTAYADRVDAWRRASPDADLLRDVYLLERSVGAVPSASRLDAARRAFEPLGEGGVPPEIAALVREASPEELPDSRRADLSYGLKFSPVDASVPALVVPISPDRSSALEPRRPPATFGFVVVALDRERIVARVLPALVGRFFPDYDVAVTEGDSRVYASSPSAPTGDGAAGRGDASATLLALALEERRGLIAGEPAGLAPRPSPESARSTVVRIVGLEAGGRTVEQFLVTTEDPGWRLVVTHRAGSLEAAVAAARARNLALGLGTLLLLAASVAALAVASRRAQRLARQQVEFVAGVSHELRTPLAVICSAAENLSHGVVTSEAQVRRYGALIEGEGRRLAELVEQVLEYGGAHSDRVRYAARPVDVGSLVDGAVAACGRAADDAGVRVESAVEPGLPAVSGDPAALGRMLQNLVGNAVKYSREGAVVRVAARDASGGVEIAVEDRGLGILAEDLPHVFEPFYRGRDAVDARIRGTGLGLSLARRVAEAHGGTITAESRHGEGSTFVVRLPPAEADARG